ncbi:MAG: TolC family protein, partial [Candidatus Latescibacteria bacterium]|nr:TolC family protein [Candidatus Latescibacterota bacterium]
WLRYHAAPHSENLFEVAQALPIDAMKAKCVIRIPQNSDRFPPVDSPEQPVKMKNRLHTTEDVVAPALATALDNMRTAYAIGRVSYSDLLEAQRALIALYHDANDARLAIVEETIAIERLTGRTVEELMGNE